MNEISIEFFMNSGRSKVIFVKEDEEFDLHTLVATTEVTVNEDGTLRLLDTDNNWHIVNGKFVETVEFREMSND